MGPSPPPPDLLGETLCAYFDQTGRARHAVPALQSHMCLPQEADEHEEIVDALAADDPRAAAEAVRGHAASIREAVMRPFRAG